MIVVERREVKACCGRSRTLLKFNASITKDIVSIFTNGGFSYIQGFYDAGILTLEDKNLTASCMFGKNEFQIKCKNKECDISIAKLENLIRLLK